MPELLARLQDQSPTRHRFRDGFNCQHNLAAVRGVMDRQGAAAWTGNLYMDWLGTLRELSKPLTDAKYRQALRTKAWAMKSLNTQLASWSQLRHDTILYAKQSYTSGGLCEFPAVLVEPHPTFWTRMREMVERTRAAVAGLSYEGKTRFAHRPLRDPESFAGAEALAEKDPAQLDEEQSRMLDRMIGQADLSAVKTRQVAHLERFLDTLGRLEAIVELRRVDGSLSQSPSLHDFACDLIQQTSPGGGSGAFRTYDG